MKKIKGLGYLSVQIQVEANETVKVEQEIENKDDSAASRDLIIRTTREEATVLVKSCMKNVSVDTEIDVDKLYLIVNTIIDEIFSSEEITVNLANSISGRVCFEHSVNVCILSVICGIYMGFNKVRLVELGIGALLHDIGKGLISQETLNKPGTLTSDEFDEIKKHTILGYEALKRIPNITETSACVALYHHERFDGAGYPTGKKAQNIHVYAKLLLWQMF